MFSTRRVVVRPKFTVPRVTTRNHRIEAIFHTLKLYLRYIQLGRMVNDRVTGSMRKATYPKGL